MTVQKVVWHLTMAQADDLRPRPSPPELVVEEVGDPAGAGAGRIRRLHDAIAAPHHWSSLQHTDQQWESVLGDPTRVHLVASVDGEDVGWSSLERTEDGARIASFGVRPDGVGRGVGGAFLTDVVRRAWDLAPSADGHRCVWLHTSSWDHPHARANYLARGFTVARTELRTARDGAWVSAPVDEVPALLVRPAIPDDAGGIQPLLTHMGYHLPVDTVRDRVAGAAASLDDVVAVAVERAELVVGVVRAHVVPLFAEPSPGFLRIMVLAVDPTRRRQGIGHRLIEFVEHVARVRDIDLLEVSSGRRPERDAAHRFYPALGFDDANETAVRYWKRLDTADD